MKLPAFDYAVPATLGEAVRLLADHFFENTDITLGESPKLVQLMGTLLCHPFRSVNRFIGKRLQARPEAVNVEHGLLRSAMTLRW